MMWFMTALLPNKNNNDDEAMKVWQLAVVLTLVVMLIYFLNR